MIHTDFIVGSRRKRNRLSIDPEGFLEGFSVCPVYAGMRLDIPCWLVHLYNSAPYIRGCSIKGAVISD